MNTALDKLYNELLNQADGEEAEEEITLEERTKRFLAEKNIVISKLKEISLRKSKEELRRKEEDRLHELERKRQAAIKKRIEQERNEKDLIRKCEEQTIRFWKRGITGKRRETGVLYFGESKRFGEAWVPHGHGEYRVNGEIIYEGGFCDGAMHGKGRLLFDTGEIWAGKFWKDMIQGIGTIISDDNKKRKAIYWRDRKICFLDDLTPGCRLQLLGDEFVRNADGEAMVVAATEKAGRYRLRLDSGQEKIICLDSERFRLLRHKPRVMTLDAIVGSARPKKLYDYVEDQAHPRTSGYRENFYWPDLWAAREKAEREKEVELELETKRLQILAKRQVEQDAKKAAAQAACVAKGLEEEAKKKAEMEQENAEAAEKGKQAMEAARIAAEAEKVRHKELSRSPPRDR